MFALRLTGPLDSWDEIWNWEYDWHSWTVKMGIPQENEERQHTYCYIKVSKVKPVHQDMSLFPRLSIVEISTLGHFRPPLLIQMFINVASSPRLSGIGMSSPILISQLLKMQRIVLLNSLFWWELGTNFHHHRSWWMIVVLAFHQ